MQNDTMTLYKLMILYFLDQVDYPLTNAQISGFLLEQEYTNYFTIQQVISDLLEADLIQSETIRNSSYFRITEEGKNTLLFFGDKISNAIKEDILHFLQENQYQLRAEVSTPVDYYEQKKGEFVVRCRILERDSMLLDFSLAVPSEEAAIQICNSWHKQNQDVYARLLEWLVKTPADTPEKP